MLKEHIGKLVERTSNLKQASAERLAKVAKSVESMLDRAKAATMPVRRSSFRDSASNVMNIARMSASVKGTFGAAAGKEKGKAAGLMGALNAARRDSQEI